MAYLSILDRRTLEAFFGSGTPTNWFASHAELDTLFGHYDLVALGYVSKEEIARTDPNGIAVRSKLERMRVVIGACPGDVLSRLLLELLEIGFGEQVEPSEEWLAGYEECKGIIQGLRFGGGEEPEIELARSYFQNQKELVLKDWNDANLGIWICQYRFGDRQLADKLLEKYRQGLTVMIILQEDEYNRRLQESHWRHMPCSVWWFPKTDGGGINHHKFCIVDGQILWHGSFNFTWSAANINQEEFTRDCNLAQVRKFSEEFTRLRRVIDEEERVRGMF